MPLFEFRCQDCSHKFMELVGMVSGCASIQCPKCGSKNASKLVSRFTRGRSEDARVDELADRLELGGEPDSAGEARALMREMGKAMDDDFSDDMEEMFETDMEGGLDDED